MNESLFMPILFKVLFGFIILNMVVNFILLAIKKERMYQLLSIFWPVVLCVFILQSSFQEGFLSITLAYGATVIPMTVFSMIGFEAVGRKFPLKSYVAYYILAFGFTLLIYKDGIGFTSLAMPLSIATATPLAHTFIYLLLVDRKKTTRMQKLLGVIFLVMPIHCINFALFRMAETQIWGWLVAYALYDTIAILLPSIALEKANMNENQRLQNLVTEKTSELSQSLKDNEALLKVLLHDVSNPLMVLKYYTSKFEGSTPQEKTNLEKIKKSLGAMEDILVQVKESYRKKLAQDTIKLSPVLLEECFKEVSFMFAPALEKKNVTLQIHNELSPRTLVLADKASLTYSVLSNLISNSLKFSYPNSEIEILVTEDSRFVYLDVKDYGPGIPQEVIQNLISDTSIVSTQGTSGEVGTGFGLSIVKSYVDSYGGQIEFTANYILTHPEAHGTSIRITLEKTTVS
jgi:signal transduction histidine kinase